MVSAKKVKVNGIDMATLCKNLSCSSSTFEKKHIVEANVKPDAFYNITSNKRVIFFLLLLIF